MVLVIIATIFALGWIFYRVSTLLNIPIPTLVKILGLDLPAPPRVSLHGVSADTITLHWSLPEKAGSVAKHIIQINGINVGESEKRGETSVTVTGLSPDQRYNVRVIAANAQNFQASGQLIRLRTRATVHKKKSVDDGCHKGDSSDDPPAPAPPFPPSVHSTPTPDVPPPSPHYGHHHNNSSNNSSSSQGQTHPKRSARDRRGSPAFQEQTHNHHLGNNTNNNSHTSLAQEDQRTVDSLTRDLDAVRKEIQETEAQLAHTEEEYKAAQVVLRAELDTLRDKKNEEDAGRQRIRAEAKALEEARRTAEAMKTRTEKSLRAKEYDIKRMQDDMSRWEEEKRLASEKADSLSKAARKSKETALAREKTLGIDIQDTQRQISDMEEEIRSLVMDIKNLESQKEQMKAEEDREALQAKEDRERESLWRDRHQELEAELEFIRSREALASSQGRRESGSGADAAQKKPKQRRHRNRKSRTPTVSSSVNGYPVQDFGFRDSGFAGSIQQLQRSSPTFSNSIPMSPYFNIANGAASGPTEITGSVAAGPAMDYLDADADCISGTPMSPTANSLLPSNLFAFEDAPPPSPRAATTTSTSTSTFAAAAAAATTTATATPPPVADDMQPRTMSFDAMGFAPPHSPMSSGSVSTSPRSSFNHIPLFPGFPGPTARDSVSLHLESSDRSGTAMSPIGTNRPIGTPTGGEPATIGEGENIAPKSNSRRFVNILSGSFNRQRGKTVGFDGAPPALGQLRPNESHSFPKNEPPGLDPIGTRRRSGSHGSWANSLDFLHGGTLRRTKPVERTNSEHSRRSATFNQFSPSFDPIDPNKLFDHHPVSPRPSSIASFDNPLPAPSSDASAAFGWPSLANQFRGTGGGGWADFRSGRISLSRPVSRPISPNANASTTSLSLFPGHLPYFATTATATGSACPTTPRLNPAAPTFQSRMSGSSSGSSFAGGRAHSIERDAISINTDMSGMSGGSLESAPTKESLLSRISAIGTIGTISRKASTGKFNISSWGRGKKKDAAGAAGGGGLDDELEEEALPVAGSGASINKGSLWSGWRKDGEQQQQQQQQESEDEEAKGRLTPLAKESSPWLKSSQSGFFGAIGRGKKGDFVVEEDGKDKEREREKEREKGGEKEKGKSAKDRDRDREDAGEKKGLGIFRRKAEKEKERDESGVVTEGVA